MATNKKKNTLTFFNSHLVSVVSISLVLFLLGLILVFGFLGTELSQYVKENITMSVVLNEDLTDIKIRGIRDELEKQPYVKSTQYISKEQAAIEMEHELGENPETFLGFNPFRASIEVKLRSEYTHPDSLPVIEKRISKVASVSDVLYRKDMMQVVNNNIRRIGLVLLILLAVLVVISFVLINNTVRLLIYSKRFIIYTMRLVGATSGFIRRPFLKHNVISGLIAGVLAILLLMGALYYARKEFVGFEDILGNNTMWLIYGIILVAGVVLSAVAAYFAVNRYLRINRGKLYNI
ncbi:MAG: permease-like cell division protein FtsX [Tannerella sp.]|jgi:cell division transport system permease protein|nr:permease-like cell division protein FtsX [Tannerella sp.]